MKQLSRGPDGSVILVKNYDAEVISPTNTFHHTPLLGSNAEICRYHPVLGILL